MDTTDRVGSAIGFIVSTVVAIWTGIDFVDIIVDLLKHLVYGGAGALGGLFIARLWKKYVDKKKDENNSN